MQQEIIGVIISQGAWASLFVLLLLYVLKTNDKRETKYQDTIGKLTEQFTVIEDIKCDVTDIKDMLR